jgi:histone H3/H4
MAKKQANKGKSMEMLLVGSKTKAALKGHGCNVASDALDGLNAVVYWYLEQAGKRAAANGRKTVRAHDFVVM